VQRLGELGWVEGRSIVIDYRPTEGLVERAGEIAAEFVRLKVDVIVTGGDAQALAAKRATTVIPIVFGAAGDPVGNGLVQALARPGGNVTGSSVQLTDTAGKRLEILREIVPDLRRLAISGNFTNPTVAPELETVQAAAHALGLDIISSEFRRAEDIPPAIEKVAGRAQELYICADPLVHTNAVHINALALAARLPVVATRPRLPRCVRFDTAAVRRRLPRSRRPKKGGLPPAALDRLSALQHALMGEHRGSLKVQTQLQPLQQE
jgi:putative ABC transport system substrate-binding protein